MWRGSEALVVMLPDAARSGLLGSIERWIAGRTGCAPVARRAFQFTEQALDQFYPGLSARAGDNWQLLCRVFSAGPSLATLWRGESAAARISAVKGETHPARCAPGTLRGQFWCDNAVANLVHVSDDGAAVQRELAVLRLLVSDLFDAAPTRPLAPWSEPETPTPRHSGILTLCRRIEAYLVQRGEVVPRLELPEDGNARATMRAAEGWLARAPVEASTPLGFAIRSYLDGTAHAPSLLSVLRSTSHVDTWEELMLRCGLLSRADWLTR